jgi:hypothetical protein
MLDRVTRLWRSPHLTDNSYADCQSARCHFEMPIEDRIPEAPHGGSGMIATCSHDVAQAPGACRLLAMGCASGQLQAH